MKNMKKAAAFGMAVLLSFSALAGCGSKSDGDGDAGAAESQGQEQENEAPEGNEVSGDKKDITLTTVSMMGGTDANADNYQNVIKEFEAANPHVKIEDNSQSSDQDWKTTVAADFAVGNEPDVIQFFTDANASEVLKADKFVTIEEVQQEYPDYAKDTLPAALQAATNPDGVQRAVPTTGFWEGLFCNKDLFDEYKVDIPTDWETLVKAIEVFKENDIIPIAVSLNDVPHYWIEFLLLYGAGPESYESVPDGVPKEWADALGLMKELRDLGAFPVDTDTVDNDYIGELFRNKQAAMQLDGSWFAGGVTDQENTVVAQFPLIKDSKAEAGAMVGGISSGFYITKKAWEDPDKREAAVEFVMANTNKEAVTIYWGGNGQAACAVDPIEGMTPLGISGLDYSSAATSISAPTDARITQEAYNTLVSGIVDVSTGARTAEELLEEVLEINAK